MSNISVGIYWSWMIAANEAYFLKYDKIEPVHFLLGTLKLADILGDIKNMLPEITNEEREKIIHEVKPLSKIIVDNNQIPLTEFRRYLRTCFTNNETLKKKGRN